MKISGYSRQQLTRLIARYRDTGRLQRQQRTVAGFRKKYSDVDIRLLAVMDERHETPCGHTLKKLCERACKMHGDTKYQVLAGISVSHLYNLRKSTTYQRQRRHFEKTRSRVSTIGERRKPDPDGQPGFLRIDTVHQGDQDKQKGVYHINAVDEVTQFEAVCSVEKISELYLIPALEAMFETFPFVILGFHADNGSEYINKRVATLLGKLSIEFTKSHSRQTLTRAYMRPHIELILREGEHDHGRLVTRALSETDDAVRRMLERHIMPIRLRYRDALRLCCPGVSSAMLTRGIGFVVSTMVQAPCESGFDSVATRTPVDGAWEEVLEEAVAFACGGLLGLFGSAAHAGAQPELTHAPRDRAVAGKCSPTQEAQGFSRCAGDPAVLVHGIAQRLQRSAHRAADLGAAIERL